MDKGDKRRQINVRLDDELFTAIDDLRAMMRPIPPMSALIREAIIEKRDRVKRKIEQEARG